MGLKVDRSVPTHHKFENEMSIRDVANFVTRPGRPRTFGQSARRRGDVNLPVEKKPTLAKPRSLSKR
jgi:hypothetical protein